MNFYTICKNCGAVVYVKDNHYKCSCGYEWSKAGTK